MKKGGGVEKCGDEHAESRARARALPVSQVMDDLSETKYQLAEWRVSIYGRALTEWDRLARWFYVHRLAHPNVRWMVQVPRLYFVYKKMGTVDSFGDMLHNIFSPLFEVTRDPASNPPLHAFLEALVGFDSVDDESKPEAHFAAFASLPAPEEWRDAQNPPCARAPQRALPAAPRAPLTRARAFCRLPHLQTRTGCTSCTSTSRASTSCGASAGSRRSSSGRTAARRATRRTSPRLCSRARARSTTASSSRATPRCSTSSTSARSASPCHRCRTTSSSSTIRARRSER